VSRPICLLLSCCILAPTASAQMRGLGTFGLWGAFADQERCYAISRPAESTHRSADAAASVGYWPRQGARGQLHFRLGAEKREESAVLLRIDGRSFQLTGRGRDAWAPDARADAELVAAMRSGLTMTVETRAARGGLVRDQYRLQGAPSAVDAAAIACTRR
jgi:hypothetical protein